MDLDVETALKDWKEINRSYSFYGRLNIQFEPSRRVELNIGYKNILGIKDRPIITRNYTLDGSVFETVHS